MSFSDLASISLVVQRDALEELPYLGQELVYIKDDPNLIYV